MVEIRTRVFGMELYRNINKTETIWEGEMLKYKVEFNVQFV